MFTVVARYPNSGVTADLRKENAKKNTQKHVAMLLGVDQATVSRWWGNGRNMQSHNTSIPDARVKIPPQARPLIRERVEVGESVAQAASPVSP